MLVGVQVRLVEVGVLPVVGRGVPVVVLLVFEVLVELLVLRVLVVRGELAVLAGFALVFVAVAFGLPVVVLRVRKRARIAWSILLESSRLVAAVCVLLPHAGWSPSLAHSCPPHGRGSSVCRPSLVLVPPSISGKS